RCLDGNPISARRLGPVSGAGDWCRRKPGQAALSVLLFVVLLVTPAALVFSVLYGRTEAARQQAELAKGQAESAEAQAEQYRLGAQRLNAFLLLRNGANLADEAEVGRGILWMSKSLQQCPRSAPDLEAGIRTALALAAARLHRLDAVFPAPAPTIVS